MKRSIVLIAFSLIICHLAYTQTNKFDNIWNIGGIGGNADNLRLKFNGIGLPPTIMSVNVNNNPLYSGGHSNLCDTNGNLVFSTDGFTIFDSNCNVMQNGDSIVYRETQLAWGGVIVMHKPLLFYPFPTKSIMYLRLVLPIVWYSTIGMR